MSQYEMYEHLLHLLKDTMRTVKSDQVAGNNLSTLPPLHNIMAQSSEDERETLVNFLTDSMEVLKIYKELRKIIETNDERKLEGNETYRTRNSPSGGKPQLYNYYL